MHKKIQEVEQQQVTVICWIVRYSLQCYKHTNDFQRTQSEQYVNFIKKIKNGKLISSIKLNAFLLFRCFRVFKLLYLKSR